MIACTKLDTCLQHMLDLEGGEAMANLTKPLYDHWTTSQALSKGQGDILHADA
jgi:hypothetical protein